MMELSDPQIKDLFDFYSIKEAAMACGAQILDCSPVPSDLKCVPKCCPLRKKFTCHHVSMVANVLVLVKFIASFLSHRWYQTPSKTVELTMGHLQRLIFFDQERVGARVDWSHSYLLGRLNSVACNNNIFVLLFSSPLQEKETHGSSSTTGTWV